MKLNPEVKKQWLEDLRGPSYRQGKHNLKTAYFANSGPLFAHCCLGVLCEQALRSSKVEVRESAHNVVHTFNSQSTMPPRVVTAWATGTPSINDFDAYGVWILPINDREGTVVAIAGLNDSGLTFAQIADLIERFY